MTREKLKVTFIKMYNNKSYRPLMIILGVFTFALIIIRRLSSKTGRQYSVLRNRLREEHSQNRVMDSLHHVVFEQEKKKNAFLHLDYNSEQLNKNCRRITKKKYEAQFNDDLKALSLAEGIKEKKVENIFADLVDDTRLFSISILLSLPMYFLLMIYSKNEIRYVVERVFMMAFVTFGVIALVFTIMHISPVDPATNILGEHATPEKVADFRKLYGLDKSYLSQLFNTFKKIVTFDLGFSYVGGEDILLSFSRKFPITMKLGFLSLAIAVIIAVPAGVISAIKQYSYFDYIFMFNALIGLSIPNFWLGLVLILNFSIKLGLLPATFSDTNMLTLIMPSVVLGTGLAANVARMTRSSMLEVKNKDYVLTARAKGLSERRVITKHILGNALIPIITVVGLQFGGLLGGASVTEIVFNVNGIGRYIIDKQFIPDIPVVLTGVVYVAIVISLVNLAVDMLYSFVDPRIKSKISNN